MRLHLLATVLLGALAGCSRSAGVSPTAPTSPAASGPVSAGVVMGLTLRGNTELVAIGQATPLTATASLSDGTSRNVTTDALWVSTNNANIRVSPGGTVTVVHFGQSHVSASYQGKSATLNVQATPPGTLVAWGRVREPGGGGLGGVSVREESSGLSTLSNADGEFSFGGLTGTRLWFEKDGLERAALEAKPGTFTEAPMQRVIRIAAGGSLEVDLAPHDASFEIAGGLRCYPCKMIRVVNAQAGRLQVKARWMEPRAALTLWIGGRPFDYAASAGALQVLADVVVDGPGELLVYVGLKNAADYNAPFTLTADVVR